MNELGPAKSPNLQQLISFDEILDPRSFEHLVTAYLRTLNNGFIDVKPSGLGPDSGVDIFVDIPVTDLIDTYKRRWIVQCKFLDCTILKSHLAPYNIPGLIHEHGAQGYLLVCKKDVHNGVVDMFKRHSTNCQFRYNYTYWDGPTFINKLYSFANEHPIIRQYFPKYSGYVGDQDR